MPAAYVYGERNGRAKLTDAQVAQMRADFIPWVFGIRRVAKKWNVPYATAYSICHQHRRIDFAALRKAA